MINYLELSYQIFGDFSKSIEKYFVDIKKDMQQANMPYTLREYLSMMIMTVAITFFAETVLLSFIFAVIEIPVISSMALALTLSFVITGILTLMFYTYPSALAKARSKNIEKVMPFATSYMSAISSGKVSIATLFKTVSQFKDYGDVAEESATIARNIELIGMSASASLVKQAEKTPSKKFKELLWGMNAIIASGGNLTFFLRNKNEEFMSNYRRAIRKYAQDLSVFIEIYLTLIVTGSIFFIVLSAVISTISSSLSITNIQFFVVFALLPVISIGFILLVKSISPTEG
ncbi:MAG: type II secretion system F family protein [Candidatus Aenigmarchaeota archaeon]|nr:type II secretion system F family protein [Candidatus Aenigmarchaeota archaeon]